MAALISTDVLASGFISSLAFILLLCAFFLQLGSYSSQISIAQKELRAMLLADRLLFSCGSEMGLAKCDPWGPDSNVLSQGAVGSFGAYGAKALSDHFGLGGSAGWEISLKKGDATFLSAGNFTQSTPGICIKRLAILERKVAILSACMN